MKKLPLYLKVQQEFPDYAPKELYAMILCGEVLTGGQVLKNPKEKVPYDTAIQIKTKKYVSRGGLKLEKALKLWNPPLEGKVILMLGAQPAGLPTVFFSMEHLLSMR